MTQAQLKRRVAQLLNAYLAAPGPITLACYKSAHLELMRMQGE